MGERSVTVTAEQTIDRLQSQLRQAFTQWADLSDQQWETVATIFQERQVNARDFVSFPGDDTHELIFVGQGLLRFYYISAEGKETNKAFIAENEFAGPLASAMLGLPIYYGIQALESTTMLVAPFAQFTALYAQDLAFERLGRKLAEQLLVRKELRMRSMLEQNARERYLDFLQKQPTLVDRIPQYHLASYLGITEVSLSRLKNS
ncbi:MAG: Crp/Fnr family transcriptional regulator [Chloroflexota bacterium]